MNSVSVDLPSSWEKYSEGLCKGCRANCCSLPVEVDKVDLVRMGLASEAEVSGSLKKLGHRLQAEGKVQNFSASVGAFILNQKLTGECIFLGPDHLCSIYENRPQVCRSFPEIGPRSGFCPCIKK